MVGPGKNTVDAENNGEGLGVKSRSVWSDYVFSDQGESLLHITKSYMHGLTAPSHALFRHRPLNVI